MLNKTLQTLIKRHQLALDEKRQFLVKLQTEQGGLRQQALAIEENRRNSWQAMHKDNNFQLQLSRFMQASLQQRIELDEKADNMQPEIDKALDEVRQAYGEVRKLEIVLDERIKSAALEAEQKEQKRLDEVSEQMMRHKKRMGFEAQS